MNRIKGFLSYSQKQISLGGNPLNLEKESLELAVSWIQNILSILQIRYLAGYLAGILVQVKIRIFNFNQG